MGGEFFDLDPDVEWIGAGSLRERYNQPLSPLGWSLLQKPQRSALAWTLEALNDRRLPPELKVFTNLHGYPFLNFSLLKDLLPLRVLRRVPGQAEAEPPPRRSRLRELLLTASFLQNSWRLSQGLEHDVRHMLPQHLGVLELIKMYRPQSLDDAEVLEQIITAHEQAERFMQHRGATLYLAELHYKVLQKLTLKWLGENKSDLAAPLLSGLPDNLMEQTIRELEALAGRLRESKQLRRWLESESTEEFLRKARNELEGMAFLQPLNSFISRRGHLSASPDVAQPFWWEDPGGVLALVRSFLQAEESRRSAKWDEARRDERERAEALVRERLPLWKRLIFEKALDRARTYLLLKENLHYYESLAYSLMKRNLKVLAARLVEQGRLSREEEIYLLTLEEITALINGELPANEAKKQVEKRRCAPRVAAEEIPLFFKGVPSLKRQVAPAAGGNLTGVAASPGKATGTVRVVASEGDFNRLRPGDVVVAKTIHPAWAPLFAIAGGVVVEYGSLSSQGAALARGHRIPSVLGVKNVCATLREGQTVTVDGTMGWVMVQQPGGFALQQTHAEDEGRAAGGKPR